VGLGVDRGDDMLSRGSTGGPGIRGPYRRSDRRPLALAIVETSFGSESIEIPLTRLDLGLPVPRYAHPGDAGMDLVSRVEVVLGPGERVVVGTGIALAIPDGFVGLVHPRSGMAVRRGLTVVNAPGTIDAGYRGEIQVPLLNTDRNEPVHIHRGDRIAQLLFQRVARATLVEVDDLPGSSRGSDGFGSTGESVALPAETDAVTVASVPSKVQDDQGHGPRRGGLT
jgi:dUTP pyrophosphatase